MDCNVSHSSVVMCRYVDVQVLPVGGAADDFESQPHRGAASLDLSQNFSAAHMCEPITCRSKIL